MTPVTAPFGDPLLGAAWACVDDFYARLFRTWPEAVTRAGEKYTLSFSGDRHLTGANHLWPHTADAITPRALAEAEDFFEGFSAAWSVVIADTAMPGAAALLEESGYYPRWQSPLMVLDGLPFRLPARPGTVLRASTPQHLEDVKQVMSEAFGTGSGVSRRVVRPTHLDDPAITHYLIYAGNEPASCATVARCDPGAPMAGVWNVGTRTLFRRQRYAVTIMLGLLDDLAARGCTMTTLMASPEGLSLYRRLGYRRIGMAMYMGPPYMYASPFL